MRGREGEREKHGGRGVEGEGGQVRPESCLCAAAGSKNTVLQCEVRSPHTHVYCTIWGVTGVCLAKL